MNRLVWIEDEIMVMDDDQIGRYEVVFIHFAQQFEAEVKSIETLACFDNKQEAIEYAEMVVELRPSTNDIKHLKERVTTRLNNMRKGER